MAYLERNIERKFLELNNFFKCILLLGARQVGKSTMLKHLAKDTGRTFVTMDDHDARNLAKNDPTMFLRAYKPPVLIDEIQKAPELLDAVKVMCDESDERGLFWLTGSQRTKLMQRSQESLAGRLGILSLYGFSQNEILGVSPQLLPDWSFDSLLQRSTNEVLPEQQENLFAKMLRGSFPDAQSATREQLDSYFDSYVENYLIADAVNDQGIRDVAGFRKFIRACAALSGEMLNYKTLAETVGVNQATAKNWVTVLQEMDVIYLLEPFANNRLKRLARSPKMYFCDTGLCAHLTSWVTPETLRDGAFAGHMFETYVVMEFVKKCSCLPSTARLFYYRDQNQKEIDLIVECDGKLHPFEIKKSGSPNTREVKKFDVLSGLDLQLVSGGLVCMREKPLPIDENNSMIPVTLI